MVAREQLDQQAVQPVYVIVWDNVNFDCAVLIHEWFTNNQRFINISLPPYSPILNPPEEFFSAWRWKVYDRQPYTGETLLEAIEHTCDGTTLESSQCWFLHSRRFFLCCLAWENIACDVDDVDEVLWTGPTQRHDDVE